MEKIVSLCKRRGFVFQGSEIFGGFSGFWDYGPLGLALKNNIKNLWWQKFVESREDMYGLDAAIIMNPKVWEASGHVSGFSDPLGDGERFNTMFKTSVGAGEDATISYLRPETAQGIFANFKNIIDSSHPKLPFGIAQIGKAFRNEIAPREFLFRAREFEQMEIEYFIKEEDWEKTFDYWRAEMMDWLESIGLDKNKIHELEVPESDRAHYSKRTIDFEYDFPFGRRELCGLAYRTDFDLKNHGLKFFDEEKKEDFIPHCIEPTFGLDRIILALLSETYTEDELGGDSNSKAELATPVAEQSSLRGAAVQEKRIFLKISTDLAPIKIAVFPLLKNKPQLVEKAQEIYKKLKAPTSRDATAGRGKGCQLKAVFDDNGNIGKRYRRQDEIGTPYCVTIDFQTLEDETVTIRDRDSGNQERVKIEEILSYTKLG